MGLGQGEGDALVLADRPAEHHPLFRIGHSRTQGRTTDSNCLGGHQHPLGVEPVDEVAEALTLLAHTVDDWHVHIVVSGLAARHRIAAHLRDRHHAHSGRVLVDEEQGHSLGRFGAFLQRGGAGEQQDAIGFEGLGGPDLATGDHILIAGSHGAGGDVGGVGAGVGFGDAERDVEAAVGDTRKVEPLHLLTAVADDRLHAEDAHVQGRGTVHRGARGGHLLQHRCCFDDATSPASVPLGNGDADPSGPGHRPVEVPGEEVRPVALGPVGIVELGAQCRHVFADEEEVVGFAGHGRRVGPRSMLLRHRPTCSSVLPPFALPAGSV